MTSLQDIQAILNLYHKGLVAYDTVLYITESLARVEAGKVGARSYRAKNGILIADFDGRKVSYPCD